MIGEGPLERPIVCPVLVGRDPHLAALDQGLALARAGRGQLVLVQGEAGIGKSRLLREVGARADDGGRPHDKRRIFHAIERLLGELSSRCPLVLVLEDLHWSDDASLECLQYLARGVPRRRILALLTFRPEEVQPSLAQLLAALERQRLAVELPLQRLSLDQVDQMLQAIFALDRPARPDFVRQVCSWRPPPISSRSATP